MTLRGSGLSRSDSVSTAARSSMCLDYEIRGLDSWTLVAKLLELPFFFQSLLHLVAVDPVCGVVAVSTAPCTV